MLLGISQDKFKCHVYWTGIRQDEGGDGTAWRGTCPRGDPRNKNLPKGHPHRYPCEHLRALWGAACPPEGSGIEPHRTKALEWTAEGIEASKHCRCPGMGGE